MKRPSAIAAVEKIEEKRKPEDFFGHRNRGAMGAPLQEDGKLGGFAGGWCEYEAQHFTLLRSYTSSVTAFAVPPSPQGEGFRRALSERPYKGTGGWADSPWGAAGRGDFRMGGGSGTLAAQRIQAVR